MRSVIAQRQEEWLTLVLQSIKCFNRKIRLGAVVELVVRFVKGFSVGHMVVKNLPHRNGIVTVCVKVLRYRHHTWKVLTKFNSQIPHASQIGSQSCHHARAGWCADSCLAIRSCERHPLPNQLIKAGCLDFVVPVTTQFGSEIIDRNEQHVGSIRLGGRRHRTNAKQKQCEYPGQITIHFSDSQSLRGLRIGCLVLVFLFSIVALLLHVLSDLLFALLQSLWPLKTWRLGRIVAGKVPG